VPLSLPVLALYRSAKRIRNDFDAVLQLASFGAIEGAAERRADAARTFDTARSLALSIRPLERRVIALAELGVYETQGRRPAEGRKRFREALAAAEKIKRASDRAMAIAGIADTARFANLDTRPFMTRAFEIAREIENGTHRRSLILRLEAIADHISGAVD
jgi:hypothetical protein